MQNKLTNSLIEIASEITVIDDGQVQYPILTEDMQDWEKEHGEITSSNYQNFCDDVDIADGASGLTGSKEMIDLCDGLISAGADSRRF